MVMLTIGMATYDDFEGVYFTVQALRMYQDMSDVEILVIDNYGCKYTRGFIENWSGCKYVLYKERVGTSAPRNAMFREATGKYVLSLDSHVLLMPESVAKLKNYYRQNPDTSDLLQGPMLYDDLKTMATHFDPVWSDNMFGIWGYDNRAEDINAEPFEIPMQGMGVFSCRKDAWVQFNTNFKGFGGEEGYIHEKFRQAGNKCLCLPFLRWLHRFNRPHGIPYPNLLEDRLRNYLIGWNELGISTEPVIEHFSKSLPAQKVLRIAANIP